MIKKCLICKKEFRVKPYRFLTAKFCSSKCFGVSVKGIHPICEFKKGQHPSPITEFKKDESHSIKGRHWKCSIENGQKKSRYWKNKPHLWQIGRLHWNWQGGITPQNKLIRRCIKLRIWREDIFYYDNWTCWICGVRGIKLHVHHLKRFSKYPELRFIKSNGITLCKFCHYTYGNHHK